MLGSNKHRLDSEHHGLGDPKLFVLFLILGISPDIFCAFIGPIFFSAQVTGNSLINKTRTIGAIKLLSLPLIAPIYVISLNACSGYGRTKLLNTYNFYYILILLALSICFGYSLMYFFQVGGLIPSQEHPLVLLSRSGNFNDKLLVAALVSVVAPIHEEVLFRGLFQAWVLSASFGKLICLFLATSLIFVHQFSQILNFSENRLVLIQIIAFLILCLGACRLGSLISNRMNKILAAAAVFASLHSFAWPSPAGLLPLACGLGWMREVSGSVLPGMVLHSLFNLAGLFLV